MDARANHRRGAARRLGLTARPGVGIRLWPDVCGDGKNQADFFGV